MNKYKCSKEKELAEMSTNIAWIRKSQENHLAHHWAVTLSMLGVIGTLAASLLLLILKLHLVAST
jgi:hypothetical protein